MRDENGNLIKTEIPRDAESICVEDFCGYTSPGHFPISWWADYVPSLGITRFGGAWWNVPDMPSTSEPSEDDLWAWARKHGCTDITTFA